MTPAERAKAAQQRFDEWDRLRRVETNAEHDLSFRARCLLEDEEAGRFKTAKQLRDAVHELRKTRDALATAKDAANKFRLFGDCEHAGCAEAAHYNAGYPTAELVCEQHEPKRIEIEIQAVTTEETR